MPLFGIDPMRSVLAQSLRGPAGWPVADFALDRPALAILVRLFLPSSRLWAAAMASGGDPERFVAEVPLPGSPPASLPRRLAAFETHRLRAAAAGARWERAFFGEGTPSDSELADAEDARARAALALAMQRLRFVDLAARRPVPAVRFAIPDAAAVDAAYGAFAAAPWRASVPADAPAVSVSRRLRRGMVDDYWIRFASTGPRIAGPAWARVHEPRGIPDPPSVVFTNGIGVEPDDMAFTGLARRSERSVPGLAREGIRVIEMELPWHGRRRRLGTYGGEPFLATPPLGPIDLLTTHAQDIAVTAAWCRATSRGRVAFAGASLGALASLLAASRAVHWPETMRPDALALLTATDDVVALSTSSALAEGLGIPAALAAAGWSDAALKELKPFVAIADAAPLPPAHIIAVLGSRDTIVPFAAGAALAARWTLPPENVFIGEAGHFSTQIGVALDGRPVRRLVEILRGRVFD